MKNTILLNLTGRWTIEKKVVIIGAGAAGLMAAGRAAERGLDVLCSRKTTGRERS
jgi:succinate dehydrogenase/fumarate reductase flavoprotein subunit